ncbi:MAG: DNA repair protein RadA [Alphaproteobacteria bacterium RIFCSPHIGHO2_02_FULL_46_13]|nr:MAG: DNA repair protein RadA [Alphaproteobacteria bacterium RIFCSPHIGHO2_02_FULL_46_13]
MAKTKTSYICQSCGSVYSQWAGKCEACGEWNSLQVETSEAGPPKGLGSVKKGKSLDLHGLQFSEEKPLIRHTTGLNEFDRVTGGGLVPGCAILLGGDPGIGKSTLLLQAVCALANKGLTCVYISGEEAVDQVRLRAKRLGLDKAPVALASATNVREIAATIEASDIDVLVIDSIQTMYVDTVEAAPGTVTQVRTAAQELTRLAKKTGTAIFFVGHVTKDGQIAGPRVLEHMVDTVLYFEGDRGHQFRILRTVKNRFGPTDEIGVFEMGELGLSEVANPSALFLSQRQSDVTGSAVFAGMEGTRPILVEVQALVAPAPYGAPRRSVIGWDQNRLSMILAVLESRCGLAFSGSEVYLNMAGGIRITEPAADLAVAAALISALQGRPVPAETVFFGEVGLSGEIRAVSQPDQRLKEAAKLGFTEACIMARTSQKKKQVVIEGMDIKELGHLDDLITLLRESNFSASKSARKA